MSNRNDVKNAPPRRVPFPVRMAAWVAGALLCLALPVIIALHAPSVQKRIIGDGIARIEKATHLEIKISSYRWKTLSSIYLTGLKIDSRGEQVLDCDNVRLDYGLSMQRPYIVIKEIDLQKPFLRLERGADGKWVVPVFSTTKSRETSDPVRPSTAWTRFKFPRIKILAGSIKAFQQGNTILSIKDFSGAFNLRELEGAGGPKIQMELRKFHARAHAGQFGTRNMAGSALSDTLRLPSRKILLSGPNYCRVLEPGYWNIEDSENGPSNLGLSNFSVGDLQLLQR